MLVGELRFDVAIEFVGISEFAVSLVIKIDEHSRDITSAESLRAPFNRISFI